MRPNGTKIRCEAVLRRPADGGDWTFLRIPQNASDQLTARSMVSIEGALQGQPFQATLTPDGEGGHWLKVERALQDAAGIRPGETVELEFSQVLVEPEPVVPEDLRAALEAAPAAMTVWTKTTAMARRDWITWMTTGKKAETRGIRLEKMIDMLSHGKKRICCFDRSGIVGKNFSCPAAAPEERELSGSS